MVLSIPSGFDGSNLSQELMNCMNAHSLDTKNCSDAYFDKIKDVVNTHRDLLDKNPEALPNSEKKIVCCAIYSMESCFLKAMSTTPGCETLYEEFLKKGEQEVDKNGISVAKVCVNFSKGSNTCQ